MRRILFLDPNAAHNSYIDYVTERLGNDFELCFSPNTTEFIFDLHLFAPDFVFINMMLEGTPAMQMLQDMAITGHTVPIVLGEDPMDTYYKSQLMSLNVVRFLKSPYNLDEVVNQMREIATFSFINSKGYYSTEIDYMLGRLGINFSLKNYDVLKLAIMKKMEDFNIPMTKELYPYLAKETHGTVGSIEKGLRDLIRTARENSKESMWYLFFPCVKKNENPSNEEFTVRMARALIERQKPRLSMEEIAAIKSDRV